MGVFQRFTDRFRKNLNKTYQCTSSPVINELSRDTFIESLDNSSPFQRRRITMFGSLDNVHINYSRPESRLSPPSTSQHEDDQDRLSTSTIWYLNNLESFEESAEVLEWEPSHFLHNVNSKCAVNGGPQRITNSYLPSSNVSSSVKLSPRPSFDYSCPNLSFTNSSAHPSFTNKSPHPSFAKSNKSPSFTNSSAHHSFTNSSPHPSFTNCKRNPVPSDISAPKLGNPPSSIPDVQFLREKQASNHPKLSQSEQSKLFKISEDILNQTRACLYELTPSLRLEEVRERSKLGMRSSLPFQTSGLGSASTSGVSSGASDTQSQGSGGTDSKSDAATPEKSAKGSCGGTLTNGSTLRSTQGRDIGTTAGEREATALRQEVETLRAEITKARQTILHMQEREKKMKERLGDQALRGVLERPSAMLPINGRLENLTLGERRPSALVRRYAHLYAQTRLDTLDALDAMSDLRQAEELKAKLLFSVVVLSFRSAGASAQLMRDDVRRCLQMIPPSPCSGSESDPDIQQDSNGRSVEIAISNFVATNIDNHDLTKNVDEVCDQIWATLYDYPCLKKCEALMQYTKSCVRIAWGLVNQSPPYILEYEIRAFRNDLHVRFHTANHQSDIIKTYMWPALLEGNGGQCLHQAVVVT